ncbi:MAG TPA: hypothetical protein VMM76_09895 [Pirellulaceae bacterium]|nr:hypothetical protein [Pirellulaceae bacterium]
MSTKIQILEEPAVSAPIEPQLLRETARSLEEIVNRVRRDSQIDPQAYLEETKVPHGGE